MEPGERYRLLIVDDETNIRRGLVDALAGADLDVDAVADGEQALRRIEEAPLHILVTDLRMPGRIGGLDLLKAARSRHPDSISIVISAYGTVESAVEAMKLGAIDFVAKPLDIRHVRMLVARAAEKLRLVDENRRLRHELKTRTRPEMFVGDSPAMKRVMDALATAAPSDVPVLLTGESGTGKELVARILHETSDRRERPFLALNCGAIPDNLFESEMFGHEAGAFTGAARDKRGLFEAAHGGTLFLDEITEIPEKNQVDLLRVLQEKEVRRVGGERKIAVDARIVSASNRDVRQMVNEGKFREDLFYRLSVFPIHLPPLRERRPEIPLLSERFLREFCAKHGRDGKSLDAAALSALTAHEWPGNIRQLRNVLERMAISVSRAAITATDLPPEILTTAAPRPGSLRETVARAEREAVRNALQEVGRHRERAAEILGISVRTLRYKIKEHGIET